MAEDSRLGEDTVELPVVQAPKPDVHVEISPDGSMTWFKPSEDPKAPVFTIHRDGRISVLKMAPADEIAKLFWEAINLEGLTFSQRLHGAEQMIHLLHHDPARQVIHDGEYEVLQEVKKEHKGMGIGLRAVRAVLDAAERVVKRSTH